MTPYLIKRYIMRLAGPGMLAILYALFGQVAMAHAANVAITGLVTDQNGQGVQNVSIAATNPGGSTVVFGPSSTASNGSYELDIDPGIYDIQLTPPASSGLTPVVEHNYAAFTDQVLDVQFSGIQAPPVVNSFSGTVTDSSGNPIQGVVLNLFDSAGNDQGGAGGTDVNGHFSGQAPAGNYKVELVCTTNPCQWDGSASTPLFDLTSSQSLVDLTSGSVTGLSFQLNEAAVTVNVVDSNGQPITGAGYQAMGSGSTTVTTSQGSSEFTGRTATAGGFDQNGSVTFYAPAGMVYNGYSSSYDGSYPGGYPFSGPSSLCMYNGLSKMCSLTDVTANGTDTATLVGVQPPVVNSFSGTVTDSSGNPIQGVVLNLFDSAGNDQGGAGGTDVNGHFSGQAPAGNYKVELVCTTNPCQWDGSASTPLFDLTSSQSLVDLTSGSVTGLSFQLNEAAVTVNVVDSNGQPITGAGYQAMGSGSTTVTTSQGSSEFTGRTATAGGFDQNGSVTFYAPAGMVYNGYSSSYDGSYPGGYPFSGPSSLCMYNGLSKMCSLTDVTANGTDTATLVGVQPPVVNSFSGTVTDSSGNPIQGVVLNLFDSAGNDQGGAGGTDVNGHFSGQAPAGNYKVELVCTTNPCQWDGSASTPLFDLTSSQSLVDLTSGSVTGLSFQLNEAAVTVNVVDSNGQPITGAGYQAMGSGSTTVTTSQGSSEFTGRTATAGGFDQNGSVTFYAPAGMVYNGYSSSYDGSYPGGYPFSGPSSLCMYNGYKACVSSNVIANGSTVLLVAAQAIPSGLTASTPTSQFPVLTWSAANGAASYNIYNGGVLIGNTTGTSFTDSSTVVSGTFVYTVTAVNSTGNESVPSSPFSVVYDVQPPSVTAASVSPTSIQPTETSTLTAAVADNLTGVKSAEYYVGADPGQGQGTPMSVNGDGTLSTTVGSGLTSGVYTLNVRAEDGAGNWSTPVQVQLTVVLPAPANLSASSPALHPSLSWNTVTGAASYNIYRDGIDINSSATSTYTDSATISGSHTYYVTAVNSVGESAHSNEVTVLVGTAPTFTTPSTATIGAGTSANIQIATTGTPDAAITWRGNLPPGVSLVDNGNGTATISGTVGGSPGTYLLAITATNLIGSTQQDFVLTVNAVTISSSASATDNYGSPFSFTVTTSGTVVVLSKSGVLPPGVTFTDNGNGTATIAGTPNGSASGAYTITIKAKNSLWTTTQIFTLTINRAPSLPTTATKTVTVGTPYSLTITSTNGSVTPAWSVTGLPNGLTLVDNGNGTATISGTPAVASGAQYVVSVTAINAYGSDTDTFKINVDEAPASITSASSATATIGNAFNFQFTTTGYPAPHFTLAGTLPTGVHFNAQTGVFSGTPSSNDAQGAYNLTITATNSLGSSSALPFTIHVIQQISS